MTDKDWQPIATAPRDGEEFQAWIVTDDGSGFWEPRCKFSEDGQFGMYGRIDYDEEGWDYGLAYHLTATHWMPQPEAPQDQPGRANDLRRI